MSGLVKWLLLAGAAGFGAFGLLFAIAPETAALVDIGLPSGTARADIRAIFGGMELGIAAFLVWASMDPVRYRSGAVAMSAVFGGMVIGRIAGLILDGEPTVITGALLAAETVGLVVGLVAWRESR